MFWLYFLVASQAHALIKLGSMDGYLNLTEIFNTMNQLAEDYDRLYLDDSSYLYVTHFTNGTEDSKKVQVVILGGFYSGPPISAFTVLQIADYLGSKFSDEDEEIAFLLNTHDFYFVPVVNIEGYELMQSDYNHSDFIVIKTGLEANNLTCPGKDVGINPYFNFPFLFQPEQPSCSNDYSGDSPLSSELSNDVYQSFFTARPDIVINYQGNGSFYIIPPSNPLNNLSDSILDFYKSLSIPDGYSLVTRNNLTGKAENGTFLDFSSNYSKFSLEVALNSNVKGEEIFKVCKENFEVFVDILKRYYPKPEFSILGWVLNDCVESNVSACHYPKYLTFNISGLNKGLGDYDFLLNFDPNFEKSAEFTAVEVLKTINGNTESLKFDTNLTTQALDLKDTLPGLSDYTLSITYGKTTKSDIFGFKSSFIFTSTGFQLDQILVNTEYAKAQDSTPMTTISLCLMISIIVVLIISAVILKYRRSGEVFKNLTKEEPKPNAI